MIRVLVADDQALLRGSLRLLVNSAPDLTAVGEAGTGAEAVDLAVREKPDVVLMDVHMPSMDGLDATRKIRELPAPEGRVPIIALTADAVAGVREQYLAAGMDDFLSKPLYPEELYARVKSLLKLKHFTDELENAEAVLFTLALGVEARDPFTGDHCSRLAHYAGELGRHLHFDYENVVAL